jgi:methylated-DNA-[protein]-cysteine S-methyltransferase
VKAQDVYNLLSKIPAGKVITYHDVAKALGCPNGSRAVGRILNRNPNPIIVPCHRVVLSNGRMGGYAFGKPKKKELLEKEGLRFTSADSIKDFLSCRVNIKELC